MADTPKPLVFPGLVMPFQRHHVLVYGPEAGALGEPLFGPPVHLRPGYRLVLRPEYLLPTAAIDDVGQRFEGTDAYTWIEQRGDAYPRADALGTLASGQPENVFIKELDLADLELFAAPATGSGRPLRLSLAIEALAVPDGDALTPIPCPPALELFQRALPCYRLAPGAFGAAAAALLSQLLATGRRDWRVTFDDLDDLLQL
jgi:hypothetical protein